MDDYGHRGRDRGCCGCCTSFIITSGLTALFIWLSLRTSVPTCSIQDFYVPALNKTLNSTTNYTLCLDLRLSNQMKDKGVRYADIRIAFFYNSTAVPVANFTVANFYQGHKKSTRRRELVEGKGVPWAAAIGEVEKGSRVKFTVQMAARVKYKIMFWYTKWHRLAVSGDVEVDSSGKKTQMKGIKMKSGTPGPNSSEVRVGSVVVLALIILLL